jgi:hypothetical protein
MVTHRINLATEDVLSETVGIKLISELGASFEVGSKFGRKGNGYLRSNLTKFLEIARYEYLFLLTDLDWVTCAPSLISSWAQDQIVPEKLLLRVAVREVESWLLADREAIASFLSCSEAKLKDPPDSLSDPKQALLQLAKKSPRAIRSELVAEHGAIASQGLGYNQLLGEFVRNSWSPERAAERSNSLFRARRRLHELID